MLRAFLNNILRKKLTWGEATGSEMEDNSRKDNQDFKHQFGTFFLI